MRSAEPDAVWCCFGYGPGVCIRYERQGSGPIPLLLLHGFAASRSTWDDLRERFPCDEYTLYLMDMKGFGRSSKPHDTDYGPVEQAAIVLAFLTELNLSGTFLVGHSYGGTVALLTAIMARRSTWRRLLAGVILMGAPAWPQPLPRFFRYLEAPLLGTLLLMILPNRYVVTRALTSIYHDVKLVDDRHRERYADSFRGKGTVHALVRTVRQMIPAQWEEFSAEYPRLEMPLLLLWGRDDRVVRVRQGERLRDTVPEARLEIIDHCGHNPHEEAPDECRQRIERFLKEVTAGRSENE